MDIKRNILNKYFKKQGIAWNSLNEEEKLYTILLSLSRLVTFLAIMSLILLLVAKADTSPNSGSIGKYNLFLWLNVPFLLVCIIFSLFLEDKKEESHYKSELIKDCRKEIATNKKRLREVLKKVQESRGYLLRGLDNVCINLEMVAPTINNKREILYSEPIKPTKANFKEGTSSVLKEQARALIHTYRDVLEVRKKEILLLDALIEQGEIIIEREKRQIDEQKSLERIRRANEGIVNSEEENLLEVGQIHVELQKLQDDHFIVQREYIDLQEKYGGWENKEQERVIMKQELEKLTAEIESLKVVKKGLFENEEID